jgi:hypothetical protein
MKLITFESFCEIIGIDPKNISQRKFALTLLRTKQLKGGIKLGKKWFINPEVLDKDLATKTLKSM